MSRVRLALSFAFVLALAACKGASHDGAEPAARPEPAPAPPPPATAGAAPERILHSVYSLFDEETGEPPGYGLYTYVLFPAPGPQNAGFVADLIASTDVASEEPRADRRRINLFSLPVRDATGAPQAIADPERFVEEDYDRDAARGFLSRLCDNPEAQGLSVCRPTALRGPYLLTHPRPQSQLETVELPYLFVDLSHVRERAYPEFIRAVKEQVRRPDFTDRERIDSFRLRLLNITLSAEDWVRPVSDGIEGIISLTGL